MSSRKESSSSKQSQYSGNDDLEYRENVFQTILDSRVRQMLAITIPSATDQIKLLKEIETIKPCPKKLTVFLDYLIAQITSLTMENIEYKGEISKCNAVSAKMQRDSDNTIQSLNEKLSNIAQLLGVKEDKIEKKINHLMNELAKPRDQYIMDDYNNSIRKLDSSDGHLCKSIDDMLSENDRIHRKLSQDRFLLIRQNEEIIRLQNLFDNENKDKESDESEDEKSESFDEEKCDDPKLRKQTQKINDLISIVNQITRQAYRLGSLYADPCARSHSKKKRSKY